MSPTPRPNKMFPTKICQTLSAVYIKSQAVTSGMFTNIIARFRPSESISKTNENVKIIKIKLFHNELPVIIADKTQPSGSQTYAMLPVILVEKNYLENVK